MLYEPTRLSAPGQIGARRQSRIERVYAWEHQPVGRMPLVSACPLLKGGPNKAPSQRIRQHSRTGYTPAGADGRVGNCGTRRRVDRVVRNAYPCHPRIFRAFILFNAF